MVTSSGLEPKITGSKPAVIPFHHEVIMVDPDSAALPTQPCKGYVILFHQGSVIFYVSYLLYIFQNSTSNKNDFYVLIVISY